MPVFKNGKWYDNYGKEITPANERGAAMSPSTSATPSWYNPPASPVARPPMQSMQYGQPPSTPSWGGNWSPKPSRQTDASLLSGSPIGNVKPTDYVAPTSARSTSKRTATSATPATPAASAPASTALATPMDTRDPGVSAYDENYGPENPAWYSGPNAGQYSGSRMEAGTEFGFGTPGPEDPSWYAEQGKKAPRPDRGFLQSLSDGIGDAMTSVDQYVKDTPNLLQLGINMMAAANAPTKAEQWQQFAGSFDKFGQANRVDEDRKLTMEDRQREIERQKKADARAEVVAGQQDTQFGWTKDEREYAIKNRERLSALQKTMIESATDPMFRQTIAAQSPETFGEFLGNRLLRQEDAQAQADRDADQRAFMATENAKDRAIQREIADFRKTPMDTVEGRMSFQMVEPFLQAAGSAGPAKERVQKMKEIITKLHEMGGANQPIDADTRIWISRLTGRQQEAQQLLTEYNRLRMTFTLDEVQKLKPASNLDLASIEKNLPNPDQNPQAALNSLTQMEKDLDGAMRGANDRIKWIKQGFSMYGTDEQGRTYFEAHPYDNSAPDAYSSGSNGQQTWKELPPVDGFDEGEIIVSSSGPSKGQRLMRQGSRWMPAGTTGKSRGPVRLPMDPFNSGISNSRTSN